MPSSKSASPNLISPPGVEFQITRPWSTLPKTWFMVLWRPATFFAQMPRDGTLWNPVLFAVLNLVMGVLLNYLYSYSDEAAQATDPFLLGGATTLFMPILLLTTHWGARRFGGTGTVRDSVRVIAYQTAVSFGSWLPGVGLLFSAYALYIMALGLTNLHDLSLPRAVVAVAFGLLGALALGGLLISLGALAFYWVRPG